MEEADFIGKKINFRWEPYYCLLPEFITKRARKILEPPAGVSLDYSNNTLIAKGAADHYWISSFRQKAGVIPGVVLVDEDNLTDTSVAALTLARKKLEGFRLFFPLGKVVLKEGQDSVLQAVIKTVSEIEKLQEVLNTPVKIVIIGNTDPSGSELLNLQLSRQRADVVLALLIKNGIHPDNITAVGSSESNRQIEQLPVSDNALNRNVSFTTSMFEHQRNSR
jgi:OOP family OmpA-OmpF porin